MPEGLIFDIKRFSIHDGPGIRTTVFLRSCPLHCWWCQNPESRFEVQATHTGKQVERRVDAQSLLAEIERDTVFYDESGGGVTFSGGEPLVQAEFLTSMLALCGERDLHRAVDTTGCVEPEVLIAVAERTDLFLYDLKLMDGARHEQYTGHDNALILGNLKLLAELAMPVQVRVPVIPGVNDDAENMRATGSFAASLGNVRGITLLPFHAEAMDKYPRFGLERKLPPTSAPAPETLAQIASDLRDFGLIVDIGGDKE